MIRITWLVLCFAFLSVAAFRASASERPNILWITSEDNGPDLGCYGDSYAVTPRIDELSRRSLRFKTCWSNAPVCAPARTTIIAGMYATSMGASNMRSEVKLPESMKLYPQILREAGYYCTNNAKTDYNFKDGDELAGWHQNNGKAHWRNRPDPSMPFFSIFNFTVSHESQIRNRHKLVHDPAKAPLPSYHPDAPEVRRDWAQYYDRLTEMDTLVGKTLDQLEKDGLADSTIVFYYGDHGSGMPRSKRWPFDSGLHVPLIVHFPEKFRSLAPSDYEPNGLSDHLVSFVDLAPTVLSLANIKPPQEMQGVPFCGNHTGPLKRYLIGFRGRMDERIDLVRSCTDGRYVYMRHFYPERPYLKHVAYMFETPTTRIWKQMFDEGKLNAVQAKFWQPKPVEELFDLKLDPDETLNLATDPKHAETVKEFRSVVRRWMLQTNDLGLLPEAELERQCGDVAPRTFSKSGKFIAVTLRDAAFLATTAWEDNSDQVREQVVAFSQSTDPGVRFWGCRGLTLALASSVEKSDWTETAVAHLVARLEDDSPSVRIAAAQGILIAGDSAQRAEAAQQLLHDANVEHVGNIAAVEALNVIDMYREPMGKEALAKLKTLPRERKGQNTRTQKYASLLISHVLDSE